VIGAEGRGGALVMGDSLRVPHGLGKEFEAKRRALSTLFRPNAKVGEEWDAAPSRAGCTHATIPADAWRHFQNQPRGVRAVAGARRARAGLSVPADQGRRSVPPGTGMDIIARTVGPKLSERPGTSRLRREQARCERERRRVEVWRRSTHDDQPRTSPDAASAVRATSRAFVAPGLVLRRRRDVPGAPRASDLRCGR